MYTRIKERITSVVVLIAMYILAAFAVAGVLIYRTFFYAVVYVPSCVQGWCMRAEHKLLLNMRKSRLYVHKQK